MNFLELKERLSVVLFGENKHKSGGNLAEITYLCLCDLATLTTPLVLLHKSPKEEVLRITPNGDVIYAPTKIQDDSSVVDIDKSLELALIYKIASLVGSFEKREYFLKQYYIEVDKFNFRNFQARGEC